MSLKSFIGNVTQKVQTINPETKRLAGDTALTFLKNIVATKESGGKLPTALDKIAGAAIKGKTSAKTLAIDAAKEETQKQFPWLIVGVLVITLIIVIYVARRK